MAESRWPSWAKFTEALVYDIFPLEEAAGKPMLGVCVLGCPFSVTSTVSVDVKQY